MRNIYLELEDHVYITELIERSERLLDRASQIDQASTRASARFHDLEQRSRAAIEHAQVIAAQEPAKALR